MSKPIHIMIHPIGSKRQGVMVYRFGPGGRCIHTSYERGMLVAQEMYDEAVRKAARLADTPCSIPRIPHKPKIRRKK